MKMRAFRKFVFSLLCLTIVAPIFFSESNVAYAETNERCLQVSERQYIRNISQTIPLAAPQLIEQIKSQDTYFLFIGYSGCKYCRDFSPTIRKLTTYLNRERPKISVYYFDFKMEATDQERQELNNYLINELSFVGTPTTVYVQNGQVKGTVVGSEHTLSDLLNLRN